MIRRNFPAGIIQKLTRQRKDRSLRQFRPVVLGMEQRLLLTGVTPVTYSVHDSNGYESNSIQDAINHADTGDTVDVDPGTYIEQLTIDNSLTIEQTPGSMGSVIIQTPATLAADSTGAQSIVTIAGAGTSVDFSGFTVEGPYAGTVNTAFYGIFVQGGANGNIHDNTISEIREGTDSSSPLLGNQTGTAIQVGRNALGTSGTATITNNTISGYQKNGIAVDNTGSSATITGNTVTGAGATANIAQNGIEIINGAAGTVLNNTVSANLYTPTSNVSTGILLFNAAPGVLVQGNTANGNNVGVYAYSTTASTATTTIQNNGINGQDSSGQNIAGSEGIVVQTASPTLVNSNIINQTVTGIDANSTAATTIEYNLVQTTNPNSLTGIELDSGTSTLVYNAIYGGAVGLGAYSFTGNTADTVVTATNNTIFSTVALDAENDDTSGTTTVQLTANNNNLSGSTGNANGSIVTTNGPVVDASDNYWGTVDPAAVKTKANGGVNVDYSPYQAAPFSNATLYVVSAANDPSQVGTTGQIQEAVNDAAVGGTVYVEPGTYTEQVLIPNSLTVTGVGGAANTTLQTPTGGDANGTDNEVTITGAATTATFSGFTVAGPSNPASNTITTGIGVNGGAATTITSNSVNGFTQAAIAVAGATGTTTISGNSIYGGVGTPIVVNSTGTTDIYGNTISGYGFSNPSASVSMTGIEVDNGTVTIGDGKVGDANSNTITGYKRTGILVSGANTTATIAGNTITGVGSLATAGEFGVFVNGGALGEVSNNTISDNQTASTQFTNSVGILLSGTADGTFANNNTLDNNDIAIAAGTGVGESTTIDGNLINTGSSSTGFYGISTNSAGTTTIDANTIDATSIIGIGSNATGTTNITGGAINSTSGTYAGIEVDQGTVDVTSVAISGGQRGIYAASVNGDVLVNLTGTSAAPTTISGANVGIVIDSSRSGANTATVNTDPNTFVTASGSDGVVFLQTTPGNTQLITSVAPTLNVGTPAYAQTQSSDGSYTASFPVSGSDNITSPNDLAYSYSVDGGAYQTVANPLTTNGTITLTLPEGNHSVMFQVMNQGTGGQTAASQTTTTSGTQTVSDGVSDGSFETPSVGTGQGSYQYMPTTQADPTMPNYNPWTFAGGAGISGTNSAFTSGSPTFPQGSQVAFIQQGSASSFTQSVTFQTSGMETLSFSAAQRANYGTQVEDFAVYVGGNLVGKFQPSGSNYQLFTTTPFAVTAGQSQTVTFQGIDTQGGDNTAFIDAISAAAAQVSTTPTVADGSFEAPDVSGQPGGFSYGTANSPWIFTGGTGIASNGSAFTGSQVAPDGSQVAILQGGDGSFDPTDTAASYFSQSISFVSGGTYVLTFSAAQRGNLSNQDQTFAVYVGSKMVGTYEPSGSGYQAFTTSSFTAAPNSTLTITFVGIDEATGDNTAFIDNVKLAVAPTTTAPTVADGSFETPSVAAQPGGFSYNTANSSWSFTGGTGIASNGSAFTGNQAAPDGSQVAILQGGDGSMDPTDTAASYFSQGLDFTTAANYTINFQAAQRNFNGTTQTQDFDVLILDSNGNVVQSQKFQPTSTSYTGFSEAFTIATAGMYTIEFVGIDTAGTDNTAFIDNVTIAGA